MAVSNGIQDGGSNQHDVLGRPKHTSALVKFFYAPLCVAVLILCVYIPAERSLTVSTRYQRGQRYLYGSWHTRRNSIPSPKTVCKPVKRLVYVKTHKTGSTTLASILERFGYLRNLTFALGSHNHILSNSGLFNRKMPFKIPKSTRKDFDMLVNHVRYNRMEMDVAVPGAKYISIIRDPVRQLESAFGYFEMARSLGITTKNPFETFMSNPMKYYKMKKAMWTRARNAMLYDLGFDHKDEDNSTKVKEKIEVLAEEIDLMLITEYFDESLILLRKLMCWEYDDILYISNGIRSKSHRYAVTEATAHKILDWNAADVLLYERFNRTLWQKIKDHGPTFQQELEHFRSLQQSMMAACVNQSMNNTGDRRVDKLTLKTKSKYCEDLLRGDVPYTQLIREGMVARAKQDLLTCTREHGSQCESDKHIEHNTTHY